MIVSTLEVRDQSHRAAEAKLAEFLGRGPEPNREARGGGDLDGPQQVGLGRVARRPKYVSSCCSASTHPTSASPGVLVHRAGRGCARRPHWVKCLSLDLAGAALR